MNREFLNKKVNLGILKASFALLSAAVLLNIGLAQSSQAEVLQEQQFTFTIAAAPEVGEEAGYPDVVVSGLWKSRNPIQLPTGLSGISLMNSVGTTSGPEIQVSRCSGSISGTWPNQTCTPVTGWGGVINGWTGWQTNANSALRNSYAFDGTSLYRIRLSSLPAIAASGSASYVIREARSTSSPQLGSFSINREGGNDDAAIVHDFSSVALGENPVFLLRRELTSIALTDNATTDTGPQIQVSRCSGTVSGTWPNQTCTPVTGWGGVINGWTAWETNANSTLRNGYALDGSSLYRVRLTSVPNLAPAETAAYVLKSSRTTSTDAVIGSVSYTGANDQPDMTYVMSGLWNARDIIQLPPGLNGIALMNGVSTSGPDIQVSRCSGTITGSYPNQTCTPVTGWGGYINGWTAWETNANSTLRNSYAFDGTSLYRIRLSIFPTIAEAGSAAYVMRETRTTTGRQLGTVTINRDGGLDDAAIVHDFSVVGIGQNPEFIVRPGLTSIALTNSDATDAGPQIQVSRCSGTISGTWPNQTCTPVTGWGGYINGWTAWATNANSSLSNSYALDGSSLYRVRLTTAPSLSAGQTLSYVLKSSRTTSTAAVIGGVSYTAP